MRLRRKNLLDHMTGLDQANVALLGLGALNWGFVGLFNFDVVRAVLGRDSKATRTVYTIIGSSAVYAIARGTQLANDHR